MNSEKTRTTIVEQYNVFDHSWNIYNNSQEMIKLADQKVQVSLVISTIVFSLALSDINSYLTKSTIITIFVILFFITSLAFYIFALLALFARGDDRTGSTVPKLVYFGHIAQRKEATEYAACLKTFDAEKALDDLCYQIYEVSVIARKKFDYYNRSWVALIMQVIFFACFVVGAML